MQEGPGVIITRVGGSSSPIISLIFFFLAASRLARLLSKSRRMGGAVPGSKTPCLRQIVSLKWPPAVNLQYGAKMDQIGFLAWRKRRSMTRHVVRPVN